MQDKESLEREAVLREIRKRKNREFVQAWFQRKRYRLILVFLVSAFVLTATVLACRKPAPLASDTLAVCVLDVGQGDSTLVYCDSAAVLIDGGDYGQGAGIVQTMRTHGISHLDAVIVTHPHADHIGGLTEVLTQMDTDALYLPSFPEELTPTGFTFSALLDTVAQEEISVRTPNCGDTLAIGDAVLTMLTVDGSQADDLNDCSVVCHISYENTSFLIMGDASEREETQLLEAGMLSPVTVLRCGHHGSAGASTDAFLDAASPAFAVISVGKDNSYGHPAAACMQRLSAKGCSIYRTDLQGGICFLTNGQNISVYTSFL